MSSVSLSQLTIDFPDGTRGLEDVSLTIADGEFIALVGPSGSGKTTLLRTIAGFINPAEGAVRIGDRHVSGGHTWVPPEHRELGMVFQQHAVWPHWNVGKNVSYPLARRGVPRRERMQRCRETLQLVGLDGYANRMPATLSGGQRQRVALARAIIARPRVLLLDEALSALDEPLRDALRLELVELTRSIGLTVVHVTHDRSEALALADRIVVLQDGRVSQIASPIDLLTRPATAEIAEFISDATVLSGTSDANGFHTDMLPTIIPLPLDASHGPGRVAVLPADVHLGPPNGISDALVVSSLFGRERSDVVLDWHGTRLRAHVRPDQQPRLGERVSVRINKAVHFPSDDARRPDLALV